jgi:hypothetical protein
MEKVVDDERPEVALDQAEGLVEKRHGLGDQGVRLGVELQAGDALADIPEARGLIVEQWRARAYDIAEAHHAGRTVDRVVGAVVAQVHEPARLGPVEAAARRGLEKGRDRQAVARQSLAKPVHAERIDHLEGALGPVVAELHGLIDGVRVPGDLGHQGGGIGEHPRQHPPGEFAVDVRPFDQRLEALAFAGSGGVEPRPFGGAVVPACQIHGLATVVPGFPVKTAAAFQPGVAVAH